MPIRPCREDDVVAIAAIYGTAVREGRASFELEAPSLDEMAGRRAALLRDGYPYLVAEIEGLWRATPMRAPTGPGRLSVQRRELRLRVGGLPGAGHRARAPRGARARGLRARLPADDRGDRDSANIPSVRLHEACGFDHVGTLRHVGWKHGTWLDTVLMQRALGPGADTPSDVAPPPGAASR